MNIYGYCRISTAKQSIDRQIRNIKAEYPTAHIVQEAYTGTSIFRPEWLKLYRVLKAGDLRDKSSAPQEQSQSQQLQLLRSAVFTSVPMNSYYGNYNCSWPPAQVQPATFSYPNMDFSSLIQQDDAQISFQALITP